MTTVCLLEGMAHMEGFYVEGSRAWRNNNPGNLVYMPWQEEFGAVLEIIPDGIDELPRFSKFPTAQAGFNAMSVLLTNHYMGDTLEEMVAKYAPASENDVQSYVHVVQSLTGIPPTAILTAQMCLPPKVVQPA